VKTLPFTKMQAQGNDFVILDGRRRSLPAPTAGWIRMLSDRRLGIGCDQVLVMEAGAERSCVLRVFNNDGSEAGNCGNGLRCVAHLLLEEGIQAPVVIELNHRLYTAERRDNGIRVHMGKARIADRAAAHVDVDLGNLHRVFFEATETLPQDRNIEIISGRIEDDVYADIIERGAGRTPACGSGACAIAAAIWSTEEHARPLRIHMPGGTVSVTGGVESIWLEGEVHTVFTGRYFMPA